MRAAAYKVDVAMQPPQARVSQAKLFVVSLNCQKILKHRKYVKNTQIKVLKIKKIRLNTEIKL